ncbi:uncharacterized protein LOC117918247 [Vitis riparia]|uniref:uncharacterized protein LOC117918247 n=1 Tax=Vitis riparia TaxID=96939 RepID=UPI00155ADCE7|nr:uncharacterized protein LOC117918247 [Vitis riparia]
MAALEVRPAPATATDVFKRGKYTAKSITTCNAPKTLFIVTPDTEGTYPVLLFLHGYNICPCCCTNLLEHISSHGYIVVAPRILTGVPHSSNLDIPVMVIGTGLGGESAIGCIPCSCAPDSLNYAEFFNECKDNCLGFVIPDYVEYRQPHVYELLVKRKVLKDAVFRHVDIDGNSALHLAAMLGENKPWLIPGTALQMQWEIKWYEFVKRSVPQHFFVRCNQKGETAKDIFTEKHMDLAQAGGEWLFKTSESCSVVSALIATVAFATSATMPGGVKENVGTPTLEDEPAFDIFAISFLVALCFSVNAVIMFLIILTSRRQERDFRIYLPRKLLVGLTSLFVSIASMLISFCAGHYFVLMDKLHYTTILVYAVTCLPVIFFAVAQFPLYFDLMWATFKKVPQRSYKVAPL